MEPFGSPVAEAAREATARASAYPDLNSMAVAAEARADLPSDKASSASAFHLYGWGSVGRKLIADRLASMLSMYLSSLRSVRANLINASKSVGSRFVAVMYSFDASDHSFFASRASARKK